MKQKKLQIFKVLYIRTNATIPEKWITMCKVPEIFDVQKC